MNFSPRTCQSLDRMMLDGLQQSVAQRGDHVVTVDTVEQLPERGATHMAVLSIASFSFRIVTALHFAYHGPTRQWVAGMHGMEPEQLATQQLQDAVCEMGNLCGGAINRELGQFQRFLGLSTPQILDGRSLPFLEHGKPQHVRHFRAQVSPSHALYATLWARAFMPMDFHWEPPEREGLAEAGELEFF